MLKLEKKKLLAAKFNKLIKELCEVVNIFANESDTETVKELRIGFLTDDNSNEKD